MSKKPNWIVDEEKINAIEKHRRQTWGKNYPQTYWPELFRYARIGLKLESALPIDHELREQDEDLGTKRSRKQVPKGSEEEELR